MESCTFKTVKEFNKQYEIIRSNILKRHEIEKGAKVRLKNAIMLYQKFNNQWVKTTSIKADMVDRIKMYNISNKNAEFKLKAMV